LKLPPINGGDCPNFCYSFTSGNQPTKPHERGKEMATYHGLIKVNCILCGYETKDDYEMEHLNDQDGTCPKCDKQFFRWENENGSVVVSLTQDIDGLHIYDNLEMRG
jgi:NAD-dependent SIR2 family protein deacetylase